MKKIFVLLVLVVTSAWAEDDFFAGFGRADITPPMGTPMPGYFHTRHAKEVFDPLYVTCIALAGGGQTGLVFTVDNCMVTKAAGERLRAAVVKATGVPEHMLFVNSTHTHTGGSVWTSKRYTDEENDLCIFYSRLVEMRAADAALFAIADLKPSKLAVGRGECKGISFVRRYRMKDGSVKTNPGIDNPQIDHPLGAPDESVQVVRFRRGDVGDIAIINFGTHPDTVGFERISADWPGVTRRVFEHVLSNRTRCMVLNGAQGDTNHHDPHPSAERKALVRGRGNGTPVHYYMGRKLAGVALQVWDDCRDVPAGPVRGEMRRLEAPTNLTTEQEKEWLALYDAGKTNDIPLGHMELNALVDPGHRARRWQNGGPASISLPLTVLAVGDSVAFAGFPGEPFTQIGLDVKAKSPFPMTLVSCLVNGANGYFPSTEAFSQGGYEAISTEYARGNGDLLVQTAVDMLNGLWNKRD